MKYQTEEAAKRDDKNYSTACWNIRVLTKDIVKDAGLQAIRVQTRNYKS